MQTDRADAALCKECPLAVFYRPVAAVRCVLAVEILAMIMALALGFRDHDRPRTPGGRTGVQPTQLALASKESRIGLVRLGEPVARENCAMCTHTGVYPYLGIEFGKARGATVVKALNGIVTRHTPFADQALLPAPPWTILVGDHWPSWIGWREVLKRAR